MAEVVFGVAASAIGVASLALQLVESTQKLKEFFKTVKNAPKEISEVIEEIESISDLLNQLSHDIQAQTLESNHMQRCLEACRTGVAKILDVSNELHQQIPSKVIRASLKFYFTKDKIRDLTLKLERGKGSLVLAYQMYTESRAQERFMTIQEQLNIMMQSQANIPQPPSSIQLQAPVESLIPQLNTNLSKHKRPCDRTKTHLSIRTPYFLSTWVWELTVKQAIRGWTVSLTPIIIVDFYSASFIACGKGDIPTMQQLFAAGEASPFDQTDGGFNLLRWAALYGQTRMFQFLVGEGAVVPGYKTFINYIRCLERRQYQGEDWVTFDSMRHGGQYIINTCGEPEDEDVDWNRARSLIVNGYRPAAVQYFISMMRNGVIRPSDAFSLIGMDIDSGPGFIGENMGEQHEDIFRSLAASFGRYWLEAKEDCREWRDIIKHVIHNDWTNVAYRGGTLDRLLHGLLDDTMHADLDRFDRDRHEALIAWVTLFHDEGVNLQLFGRAEAAYVKEKKPTLLRQTKLLDFFYVRLISLTYGPDPAEFRLWLQHPGDWYAGVFWDMLEHPERQIPGALDDDGFFSELEFDETLCDGSVYGWYLGGEYTNSMYLRNVPTAWV